MIKREDVYKIGQITKTHGLKGEVVFNFVDDIFDRTDSEYLICDMDDILVPFFIEEYRFRSDSSALVKFEDIDSADAALRLRGVDVYFEKKFAVEADEDEMSLNYFIGFSMEETDGTQIGEIVAIDDNTDNWLFVVERKDGSEVLIPAHDEFVAEFKHEEKVVVVDLPEGLLDL
jgi:16S rRNA processing protein RimM